MITIFGKIDVVTVFNRRQLPCVPAVAEPSSSALLSAVNVTPENRVRVRVKVGNRNRVRVMVRARVRVRVRVVAYPTLLSSGTGGEPPR